MFKRIVVGTDGSETAQVAVSHATELAKATGAALDIVSAFEPVPSERLQEDRAQVPGDVAHGVGPRGDVNANLDNACSKARGAGVEVSAHPREGDPADAILDVAEETGADLIVVGNKGMTGARRFLLGSVPNKVSHHAPCGVYIVRTTQDPATRRLDKVTFSERDRELMELALSEAERAGKFGDVPIGAVLASEGHALSFAGNERERRNDPTAHAEMIVLRAGAARTGGWRLPATTLYVTLEPCAMCAGAIVLARVPRVVYATPDPKAGAVGSVLDILADPRLNHNPVVESGLMAEEAAAQLREFFAERR